MAFEPLNVMQKDALLELFNMGLAKSADAMASLTDERILIRCTEILEDCDPRQKIHENSLVLSTQIIGEVEGQCCLVLSMEEANYLVAAAFGWQRPDGQFVLSKTDESFLLELDNIVTAAVITQISNKLGMSVFGDVPKLYSGKEFLESFERKEHLELLYFNTNFKIKNDDFLPGYYWFLERKVYDKLLESINL